MTGIIIASVHILRKQPVLWCYVEAARARNVTDSGDRSSAPETNGRYRAFTGPLYTSPAAHGTASGQRPLAPRIAAHRNKTTRLPWNGRRNTLAPLRATRTPGPPLVDAAIICLPSRVANQIRPCFSCLDVNYAYPMHALHTVVQSCFIGVVALLFRRRLAN